MVECLFTSQVTVGSSPVALIRRDDDTETDKIGRQCLALDALDMWRGYSL